ncbi:MAG TPA: DNA-processing protein DprA [Chthoniobacterales bacterium]|nr:DNA-processing protein DprA [Chthoniobacterales bacterium]
MTQKEAFIALNMVPRLGPVRLRRLLEIFDSPGRLLSAKRSELQDIEGLNQDLIDFLVSWESVVDLQQELSRIDEFGATVLTLDDADYPALLREIHDPPTVLYVWGKLELRDHHAVGVVGSRRTSHYGLECAKKISYQIAYAGLTVVSGLARGIDTAAHQGALAAKGRTVAVLGTGLHHLYPAENRALAEKIISAGAVVTEFPMDTKPDRQTFPMRNRIISGWGSGLLVVEAGINSGALISASQAAEQGRNLYAIPGPIDRPTSHGANRLIQQGAKLVMSVDDILEDVQRLFPKAPELLPSKPPDIQGDLLKVYDAITSRETSIDEIIQRSGIGASSTSVALLQLEMRHLVKQLPGKYFVKLL